MKCTNYEDYVWHWSLSRLVNEIVHAETSCLLAKSRRRKLISQSSSLGWWRNSQYIQEVSLLSLTLWSFFCSSDSYDRFWFFSIIQKVIYHMVCYVISDWSSFFFWSNKWLKFFKALILREFMEAEKELYVSYIYSVQLSFSTWRFMQVLVFLSYITYWPIIKPSFRYMFVHGMHYRYSK